MVQNKKMFFVSKIIYIYIYKKYFLRYFPICFMSGLIFFSCAATEKKHISGPAVFKVSDMRVRVKKNWGYLADFMKVRVNIVYRSDRKIEGFSAEYPKKSIAEHIRKRIENSLVSLKPREKKDSNDFLKRKCLIRLTPKFGKKLKRETEQRTSVKFSVPTRYTYYADIAVQAGTLKRKVRFPFEIRTEVIFRPGSDNKVIFFHGNISEENKGD